MSRLQLERVSKAYGDTKAVDSVSLEVAEGEMVVLLGPSGCGKTTTLRMIAGFVDATEGDILLDGQSIAALPAHRREMGIVFQSYALFPHLSVARNVAFGLEMRREPRAARTAQVAEMLRLVKLEAYADRLPRHLSGGQQQRVAIARALAIHPRMLLLDEPLSNLDAELRLDVAREIRLLQRDRALTTIMVTHDQNEAMAMADRLVVMRDGRVEQSGRQEDLYERPETPFVARFIGNSNLVAGRLGDGSTLDCEGGARVALASRYAAAGSCALAIRPEKIAIAPAENATDVRASGIVQLSTYLGAIVEHVVRIGSDVQLVVRGPNGARRFAPGERVALTWSHDSERVFDVTDRPAKSAATATASDMNVNARIASNV
ncbi:MAG TPA: ABC transporter ATP-binding protein [Acetobacteraceae bacterium]|nr:ABC transporter ATP-binding protein [Acetobacteraceae bacterium]